MFKMAKSSKRLETKKVVLAGLLTAISIVLTRFFSLMIPLAGMPALRIGFGDIPIIMSGIFLGPLFGGMTGFVADIVGYIINPMGAYFPGFTLSSTLVGVLPGLIFGLISNKNYRIDFKWVNSIVTLLLGVGVIFIMFENNVLSFSNGQVHFYDNRLALIYVIAVIVIIFTVALSPFLFLKKFDRNGGNYSLDKIMFIVSLVYMITSLILNTWWLTFLFPGKGFLVFLPGRVMAAFVVIPVHSLIVYTLGKLYKYQ